jgi:hypothetical protein
MLFQLAFELSLGLMWGAFVGYLPWAVLRARMAKKAAKNAIDAPVPAGQGTDLRGMAARLLGKTNAQ